MKSMQVGGLVAKLSIDGVANSLFCGNHFLQNQCWVIIAKGARFGKHSIVQSRNPKDNSIHG
jgi:hypothetical protein